MNITSNHHQPNTGVYIFIACVLVLVILAFTNCTNAKKATRFLNEHPEVAAEYCAKEFPVRDSLIKGDSVVLYDTLWGLAEPIIDTVVTFDTVRITKTLPAKIITKTVHIKDTIIRENFARVTQLLNQVGDCNKEGLNKEAKIEALQSDLSDMKKSRNKFRLWFWICVGAAGMFTFLKIKKIL